MQAALKVQTTVLPGHRIEIDAPDIPEGSSVELVVYCLPVKNQLEDQPLTELDSSKITGPIYPPSLYAKYDALIQLQWQRPLAEIEQQQLETIRLEMDALDSASDTRLILDRQIANIHSQLAAIRAVSE